MRVRPPRIVDLAGWVALAAAGMVLLREARAHGDPSMFVLPIFASATLLILGRAAIAATFGPGARRPAAAGVCLFGLAYLGLASDTDSHRSEGDKLLPGQLVDAAIDANTAHPPNWIGRSAYFLGVGYATGPMTLVL